MGVALQNNMFLGHWAAVRQKQCSCVYLQSHVSACAPSISAHLHTAYPPSHALAGPLKAQEARSGECVRVQFGGEKADTYFGGYGDDAKEGPGVYCFAAGAFYVGEFKVRVCVCGGGGVCGC